MFRFPADRRLIIQQLDNRLNELEATLHRDRRPIDGWETVATGPKRDVEPPPSIGWTPFEPGTRWGGPDVKQWFRATVTIPAEWSGECVDAVLSPGEEALCHLDGEPVQGLDASRSEVILRPRAEGGESIAILIDAYAKSELMFAVPWIAVRDTLAWEFYYDLRVALDVALAHGDESDIRRGLLVVIYDTLMQVDLNSTGDIATYHEQLKRAGKHFRAGVKEYRHSYNQGSFTVMGQSHLDTAWLWPLSVTRKKCARTFSTALNYMDQYPEYTFIMTQPQLYEYVKEHYPTIWTRLKEKVVSGQWEVAGAPWVEQDLNVPSGESHVRQYLYGNRFFRREFGIHSRLVWMPDCFGYTFSLPQIMKKAQIDYFYTTKLHGNEYNRHPYDLFRWRGLDGSEVLALQTPNACNDRPTPERLKAAWDAFRQKDIADGTLYAFGFGDGGGGPTLEQIEYTRRLTNASGIPRLDWGTAEGAYDRHAESIPIDDLPVHHDEMFYEKHRGCQTTQAHTKRNNRKCELLARDAEYFSALAHLDGHGYDHTNIDNAWKLILLNQFHDILPGSSIPEVYEDADRDYEIARSALVGVRDSALAALDDALPAGDAERAIVVRNTLGWVRDDVAFVSGDQLPKGAVSVQDAAGHTVPSQPVTDADGKRGLLFETNAIPSLGQATYHVVQKDARSRVAGPKPPRASKRLLENDYFRVRFASNGTISDLLDKRTGRHVLPRGARGNELMLHEDRPAGSDAWDINFNIDDVATPVDRVESIEVVERGPVRATIRIVWKSGRSTISQDISLWRTIPRIDFATRVDWHEKHKLLRACFPVDVTSRRATFEIQYGAIERPTHRSTEWDAARFEVPGHRWIDLSETGYGVSLLNDCKYGFDVTDNVMRISLLRAPTHPDPHADEGEHEFVCSLMPHAGSWQEAETVRRGYELNAPLVSTVVGAASSDSTAPGLARVDAANVVIDCIKKAEDSDDVIVRLYESHGSRGPVRLTFGRRPHAVVECDLMEENDTPIDIDGDTFAFDVRPWDIRTFKVHF